jgi:sulfite reductase alpha subunit-like flavoprotein
MKRYIGLLILSLTANLSANFSISPPTSTGSSRGNTFDGWWGGSGKLEDTKKWVRKVVQILQPEDYKNWKEDFIDLNSDNETVKGLFIKKDGTQLEIFRWNQFESVKDLYETHKLNSSRLPESTFSILYETPESIIYEWITVKNGIQEHYLIKAECQKKGELYEATYHKKNTKFTEDERNKGIDRLKNLSFFKKGS